MIDAETKTRRRREFAETIGGPGGVYYRRMGLLSHARGMQVYDACMEVYEGGGPFTRPEFRQAVRARLCQAPYGFDPWTLLLIVRLIGLFIEMWFMLDKRS